jgi:hypothetical protein
MAKNVKTTAQIKSRITKLSKKSNEELIDIILRKDKVERNYSKQIINLKATINDSNARMKALTKDTRNAIEEWKNKYYDKCQSYDALNKELEKECGESIDYKTKYEIARNSIEEKDSDISLYQKVLYVLLGFSVISIMYSILS